MPGARILLVDDNIADVKLLNIALREHGQDYELEVLGTGEDALRFVNEHANNKHDSPCVILLDLNLPRHDGLTVLAAIKQSPELSHVTVVVLSGFASPEQRRQIEGFGAVYMQKPLELTDYLQLGTRVMEICNGARAATA